MLPGRMMKGSRTSLAVNRKLILAAPQMRHDFILQLMVLAWLGEQASEDMQLRPWGSGS